MAVSNKKPLTIEAIILVVVDPVVWIAVYSHRARLANLVLLGNVAS
jgi:hypothetical protein